MVPPKRQNKKKKLDNPPPNQRRRRRTVPNELVARQLNPGRRQRGGGGDENATTRADASVPGVATATAAESNGGRGDAVADAASSATAGPKSRSRSDFMPSHPQLSALVAKCLPLEKASLFPKAYADSLDSFQKAKNLRSGGNEDHTMGVTASVVAAPAGRLNPGADPLGFICRSPVSCIRQALENLFVPFGSDVTVTRLESVDEVRPGGVCPSRRVSQQDEVIDVDGLGEGEWLQFFLMDVVLERQKRPPRVVVGMEEEAGPSLMPISDMKDMLPLADPKFRSVLAVIPDAGIFYCVRDRHLRECVGMEKPFLPLDISMLRLNCHSERAGRINGGASHHGDAPWFASRGYVRRLFASGLENDDSPRVWRISITNPLLASCSPPLTVARMFQMPDQLEPPLPPDVYVLPDGRRTYVNSRADATKRWMAEMDMSTTTHKGGRHYVVGALHSCIPDDCWVVEADRQGPLDIVVVVQKSRLVPVRKRKTPPGCDDSATVGGETTVADRFSIDRQSVVKIRFLGGRANARHLRGLTALGDRLRLRGSSQSRDGRRDLGAMYSLGTKVAMSGDRLEPYAGNSVAVPQLARAVAALHYLGSLAFPSVTRNLQDYERDVGVVADKRMETAISKVGLTLDISHNLSNASHFDINDASQGFSVWTETLPNTARQWYFVLPGLYGRTPSGVNCRGVAIKLTHGVAISWDGRVIRHCTSVVDPGGKLDEDTGKWEANHVFGTFCAAKAKIIKYGRKRMEERRAERPAAAVVPEARVETAVVGDGVGNVGPPPAVAMPARPEQVLVLPNVGPPPAVAMPPRPEQVLVLPLPLPLSGEARRARRAAYVMDEKKTTNLRDNPVGIVAPVAPTEVFPPSPDPGRGDVCRQPIAAPWTPGSVSPWGYPGLSRAEQTALVAVPTSSNNTGVDNRRDDEVGPMATILETGMEVEVPPAPTSDQVDITNGGLTASYVLPHPAYGNLDLCVMTVPVKVRLPDTRYSWRPEEQVDELILRRNYYLNKECLEKVAPHGCNWEGRSKSGWMKVIDGQARSHIMWPHAFERGLVKLESTTRVEVPCRHLQLYVERMWRKILVQGMAIHTGTDHRRKFRGEPLCCFFVGVCRCPDTYPVDGTTPPECLELEQELQVVAPPGLEVCLEDFYGVRRFVELAIVPIADILGCAKLWVEVEDVRDLLVKRLKPYVDLWLEVDLVKDVKMCESGMARLVRNTSGPRLHVLYTIEYKVNRAQIQVDVHREENARKNECDQTVFGVEDKFCVQDRMFEWDTIARNGGRIPRVQHRATHDVS